MLAIKNAVICLPDHFLPGGTLLCENGKIVDFGKKILIPDKAEIIDAKENFVGPGLIDIHTHAAGGKVFSAAPEECSKLLFKKGVTSVCPTLYFSLDANGFICEMDILQNAVKDGKFPNFAGFYMEGPYMNPKFGANRENNPWNGDIKKEEYEPILKKAGKYVKVWALAPERDGILEFVQDAKAENPDVVFSVAHSEATPEEIEMLMPYGLKIGTHHTNATGTLESFPECRGVCVDEAVNYNNEIYAELICDKVGVHVNPYLLRLIAKIKGKERIILISDCSDSTGPVIPGCEEADDICFDFSGEISGSKLSLNDACRNMMVHTGCSVCDCFRYASLNPARALGMRDLGEIKIGNTANLVIADNWFNVKATIFRGELVAENG